MSAVRSAAASTPQASNAFTASSSLYRRSDAVPATLSMMPFLSFGAATSVPMLGMSPRRSASTMSKNQSGAFSRLAPQSRFAVSPACPVFRMANSMISAWFAFPTSELIWPTSSPLSFFTVSSLSSFTL